MYNIVCVCTAALTTTTGSSASYHTVLLIQPYIILDQLG